MYASQWSSGSPLSRELRIARVKQFLITYRLKDGMEQQRQADIATFIAAIDGDPELRGRVSYSCMKKRGGNEYYHIATVADDTAREALQSRDFFARYTESTDAAAIGEVDVLPLEIIAETSMPVTAPV